MNLADFWCVKITRFAPQNRADSQVLAIDFGLRRIGVAWKCNGVILPLPAIKFNDESQVVRDLGVILNEKKIATLLVGIPQNSEVKVALDAILAQLDFGGEVKFIDEDLSSQEAESHINGRKNSKKLRKDGTLDSLSAMVILERGGG